MIFISRKYNESINEINTDEEFFELYIKYDYIHFVRLIVENGYFDSEDTMLIEIDSTQCILYTKN